MTYDLLCLVWFVTEGVNGSAENGLLLGNQSRGPNLNHSPQSLTSQNSGSSFIGILDMFGFEDSQVSRSNMSILHPPCPLFITWVIRVRFELLE